MWPFRRKTSIDGEDTLRTVRARLEDAEETVRKLRAEWVDVLDRFERIAGRITKRAQRDAEPEEEPAPPPVVRGTIIQPRTNGATDPKSASILARRHGLRVRPGGAK